MNWNVGRTTQPIPLEPGTKIVQKIAMIAKGITSMRRP
jgi:hypothetical protein